MSALDTGTDARRRAGGASRARAGPADPFDPHALAKEHGIAVYTLSGLREFGLSAKALSHFTVCDSSAWSAALVPLGGARVIIENESHRLVHRRSNIAHELGHHLLEHPFARATISHPKLVLGEALQRQVPQPGVLGAACQDLDPYPAPESSPRSATTDPTSPTPGHQRPTPTARQ
jgi:IrrE N-terminal-like domain